MRRHLVFIVALVLVAVGAAAFRLPRLAMRPMHTDEANQAFKAGLLHDRGTYRYNPREHHGPTLYYFTLPSFWLSGAESFAETNELHYRIVPVVFGVGVVLLLVLVGDGLGRPAALCAGVLAAVSPAMVFYSRYYIQEMLLVFFTFGAIAAGWRYAWTHRLRWALVAGAFLGLMHATKETCVLSWAAMALAVVAKVGWRRWWGYPVRLRTLVSWRHAVAGVLVAAVVSVVFFSSFFTHWAGPLDSVRTYAYYLDRSGGSGLHDHPWHYYLKTLLYTHDARGPWWSEAFIMGLAAVGFLAVLPRNTVPEATTPLARFVAFYTLFLTAMYSVIPYKTPWSMLGFLHGMILLAGVGASVLLHGVRRLPLRIVVGLLLAAGTVHLGLKSYDTSYVFQADQRNPLVYGHTSPDVFGLVNTVHEFELVHPKDEPMIIELMAPEADYWPLPFYLRRYPVVYPPTDYEPSLIIVHEDVEGRPGPPYVFVAVRGLRPDVNLWLYARADLVARWREYIATRPVPADR
ncbi:MAG: flippase activity-associated protein Agl23 [Planctomycetota bacterium]